MSFWLLYLFVILHWDLWIWGLFFCWIFIQVIIRGISYNVRRGWFIAEFVMLPDIRGYSICPRFSAPWPQLCAFSSLDKELRNRFSWQCALVIGFMMRQGNWMDPIRQLAGPWWSPKTWNGLGLPVICGGCRIPYVEPAESWHIPKGGRKDGRRWWSQESNQEVLEQLEWIRGVR